MNDCTANCPFCNSAIEFSIDLLDTIILCPCCKEEICFSENDIIEFSEAGKKTYRNKKREEEARQKEIQAQQRIAEVAKQKEIARLNQQKKQERCEYKVLTQKDKWFSQKFDPEALEKALNSYASQGWKVVSAVTATFPGFIGGNREEMVVILERDK